MTRKYGDAVTEGWGQGDEAKGRRRDLRTLIAGF